MIIGITGSFGSGKTTVANLFKKYNFKIVNVDKLYYGIYKTNKSLKIKLKKEFGTANRAKIKKIVFNDYKKLKSLNEITHPIILNETIKKIRKIRLKDKKINVMIDAPLLLEAKAKKLVDKIIVVKCKKNIQIKKYSEKEIENIIKSQMPLKEKLKHADFVVDNSYPISNTENQVKKIINNIKN